MGARTWKFLGVAGLVGVTGATGVVLVRRRRAQHEYDPDELRERLHERLAESRNGNGAEPRGEAVAPPRET